MSEDSDPTPSSSLRGALTKINAIRNSIIGCQTVNWSEHIYPLVAALEEVGFKGDGYPASRKNVGTLLDHIQELENKVCKLRRACEVALACFTEGIDSDCWEGVDLSSVLREALEDEVSHLDIDSDGLSDSPDYSDGAVTHITYSEDGEIHRQAFKKSEIQK